MTAVEENRPSVPIGRMPPLTIVAAHARNGVIGCGGKLPWHEPEDLKRFKALTLDHAIIMGRKTWDSIGRPLPRRRTIILTRHPKPGYPAGVEQVTCFKAAVDLARETDPDPRVVGGSHVYWAALPWTTTMHLTEVCRDVEGDACFPDFAEFDFEEVAHEDHGHLVFRTWQRRMFEVAAA